MADKILEAVKKAREQAKKRNFEQSFDLIINIKNVDLKKPQNRFTEQVVLPKGRGKPARIGVIGSVLATKIKNASIVIKTEELDELEGDKKKIKQIASQADFFVAEPQLMAKVGKIMGGVLGPRGKMPRPVPQNIPKPEAVIEPLERTVRVVLKESPVIQCLVGSESMSDEDVAENIREVLSRVTQKLPNKEQNIRSVYVKLTMGPSIEIE